MPRMFRGAPNAAPPEADERSPPPRFVCDEMLKRLARWLRAAGYDAEIADDGASDRAVLARALDDGRLVITRDRKFTELRDAEGRVVVLRANTLEDGVRELTAALGIDWLYRPFSRCLVCNTPLVEAGAAARQGIPGRARELPGRVQRCAACARLYWAGGHVRRMRGRLERWSRLAPP